MLLSILFILSAAVDGGHEGSYDGGNHDPHERKKTGISQEKTAALICHDDVLDVLHYRLDLTFPLTSSAFSGIMTADIRLLSGDTEHLVLHMAELTADSVRMGGGQVSFSQNNNQLIITPGRTLLSGDTVNLQVMYHGVPDQRGFYFNDRCAYTFSEPEDARFWFPCHDVPRDKATAELSVTVPVTVDVASIGTLRDHRIEADGQWQTFVWGTDLPVATYLMCVTMSEEYAVWSDWYAGSSGDSIELAYYVFREDSDKAVEDFRCIPVAMDLFSELFGPYPFEKYGMAEVTARYFGGMEHQTMASIDRSWFQGDGSYEEGYVHELAHMWWGDEVTLSDWPAIWLNEGFASYSEALYIEHVYGEAEFREHMKESSEYYFSQAGIRDFAVFDPEPDDLFNWGIIYNKGKWILHMLRHELGDSVFFAVLREYNARYEYGNASIEDFKNVCEALSGRDLAWFFEQWIQGEGFPLLHYQWEAEPVIAPDFLVNAWFEQAQEAGPCRFSLDVRFERNGNHFDTTFVIAEKFEQAHVLLPFEPDQMIPDPGGWVLMRTKNITGKAGEPDIRPLSFRLYPNYPNPFNSGTRIRYDMPDSLQDRLVDISVFNVLGKKVRTLFHGKRNRGSYQMIWDGTDESGHPLSSGIYIVHLSSETGMKQIRAVILK